MAEASESFLDVLFSDISESARKAPTSKLGREVGVVKTEEFERVKALPRRIWEPEQVEEIRQKMNRVLAKPGARRELLPIQALALFEIVAHGGLLGPIGVGNGKTLISLLAPTVTGARLPLIVMPAALIEKTKRERKRYSEDFQVSFQAQFISYEALGRTTYADFLDTLKPDIVICDEAHRIKNKNAAVTRRMVRYLKANPSTKFVALSGTLITKSILDFAHLSEFALHENTPLPRKQTDLKEWAMAVDHVSGSGVAKSKPGVLTEFSGGKKDLSSVRQGLRDRIVETPGVVATVESGAACSLAVNRLTFDLPPTYDEHFHRLRNDWETPDGWPLMTPLDIIRHAQELALGFYYYWDPRPPEEWMHARREWARFVRATLAESRTYDSPLAVAQAVDRGAIVDEFETLSTWREVQPTFTPNQKARWLDDTTLRKTIEWMDKRKSGIVFVDHVEFGERLEAETGRPYFRQKGLDKDGNYIEDAKGVIIASRHSNAEGRNLQTNWNEALIVTPNGLGKVWEQLLGRLHRTGQLEDQVTYDVFSLSIEHEKSFANAQLTAALNQDMTGQPQQLLYCDLVWDPMDRVRPASPIWLDASMPASPFGKN